jgi:hypothetical protein
MSNYKKRDNREKIIYIDFIGKSTTTIPISKDDDLLTNKLTLNFESDHIVLPKRFLLTDTEKIKNKLYKKFKNNKNLLCLDFHGVADLFNPDEKIPSDLDKCIISYIGGSKKTFVNVVNDIVPRIKSNEVKLGIIVYTKDEKPICGTKGWVLSMLQSINPKLTIYFIDDSSINVKCVKNTNSNIKTYFINKFDKKVLPKMQLVNILEKINKL